MQDGDGYVSDMSVEPVTSDEEAQRIWNMTVIKLSNSKQPTQNAQKILESECTVLEYFWIFLEKIPGFLSIYLGNF